jgi:hypothetical protein
LPEIDHGLAAIAAFAMKMLEEIQGQSPSTVEEINVPFFGCQKVAAAKLADEIEEAVALAGCQQGCAADDIGDLRQGAPHVL